MSGSFHGPPVVRGNLAFGNTLQYVRDPLGFLASAAGAYGDVCQLKLAGETCFLLANPHDIETVLCTRSDEFCKDKLIWRSPMRLAWRMIPPFQKRLLYSEADNARRQPGFWRAGRKLVQPAFLPQNVNKYSAIIREETEQFIARWEPGKAIDLVKELTGLMLIVNGRCFFGVDFRGAAAEINKALSVLVNGFLRSQSGSRFSRSLPLPSNVAFRKAFTLIDGHIRAAIMRSGNDHSEGEMLQRLLEARDDQGEALSKQAIRNEAITMLLAAHETAALSTAYGLFMLCGDESRVERALAGVASGDFNYLAMALRESNRLYPAAWLIGREARQHCEIAGFSIPAGAQLLISQWVVHRDARWYAAPHEFRPERWADGLLQRNPRCSYLSFGHGPAACVGEAFSTEESLQVIAVILRKLRLVTLTREPLKFRVAETLKPRDGLPMRVEGRR
jgi:cytochrome P450